MPRNPEPTHYIGYEVANASHSAITFTNGAKLRGEYDPPPTSALKGSTLRSVATSGDGVVTLWFDEAVEFTVKEMKISDPSYPGQVYSFPFVFDPETPAEPERPEPEDEEDETEEAQA
jgi:hypothetical protein